MDIKLEGGYTQKLDALFYEGLLFQGAANSWDYDIINTGS